MGTGAASTARWEGRWFRSRLTKDAVEHAVRCHLEQALCFHGAQMLVAIKSQHTKKSCDGRGGMQQLCAFKKVRSVDQGK